MSERVTYDPRYVRVTFTDKEGREHVMRGYAPGEFVESHPKTIPVRLEFSVSGSFDHTLAELHRRSLERTPQTLVLDIPARHSKTQILDAVFSSISKDGHVVVRGRVSDTDFTTLLKRGARWHKRERRRARMRIKKRRGWI